MIRYKCVKCGELLESPDSLAGQRDTCPLCGGFCVVPRKASRRRLPTVVAVAAGAAAIVIVAVIFLVTKTGADRPPGPTLADRYPRSSVAPAGQGPTPADRHQGPSSAPAGRTALRPDHPPATRTVPDQLHEPAGAEGEADRPEPKPWGSAYPCRITNLSAADDPDTGGKGFAIGWEWKPGAGRPDHGDITLIFLLRPKHPVTDLSAELLRQMKPPGKHYFSIGMPEKDLMRVVMGPPTGYGALVLFFSSQERGSVDLLKDGTYTFAVPPDHINLKGGLAVGLFKEADPKLDQMQSSTYVQVSDVASIRY
ncbi:MAG: hypothetical protein ACYS5V_07700 [Planctomycetota bacterium]